LLRAIDTFRRSLRSERTDVTTLEDQRELAVQARTRGRPRNDVHKEFLAALRNFGDDPFDEHASVVHVTASALIVGPRGLVLHRHKVLGTWFAPGGHIDPARRPWQAAAPEAGVETGLNVAPVHGTPNLVRVDVPPGASLSCPFGLS
jgi:8-oxo-dGTP pyrophosphatase MutT (NUDIX family)